MQAFIRAHLEAQRRIASEPGFLGEMIQKYKSELSTTPTAKTIDSYKTKFKLNGITEKNMQYTIEFFTGPGAVQPGLTVSQVADLTYLNAVLQKIGKK